jgi:hypothetical protein
MIKIKEENNKIYLLPDNNDKIEGSENDGYPISIRLNIHNHLKYIITGSD